LRGSTCAGIRNTGPIGRGAPHCSRGGGCDSAEDPRLDARDAQPLWDTPADDLLQVRASQAHGAASDPSGRRTFDLWRMPGRKRLVLRAADLSLTAEACAQRWRLWLAGGLADGAAYACLVPLGPELRGRLDAFNAQARALAGDAPRAVPARPVSRAALLHLRALQALDAALAGASHRDIAQALFGSDAVAARWHADGELRASVRHLLRRAEAYMRGGYLALAGIRRTAAECPGDEPMR
jgi:hypothetical protein